MLKCTNRFITEENGMIVSLGTDILPYIKKNLAEPFSFPSGKIEKDDLVIYINYNCSSCGAEDFNALQEMGIACDKEKNQILAIGLYQNMEVQPIVKQDQKSFFKTTYTLIDTFFSGKEISIHYYFKEKLIAIQIDSQNIILPFSGEEKVCILANENGIRYYSVAANDDKACNITSVLNGNMYDAYIEPDFFLHHVYYINDLFPIKLSKQINHFDQDGMIIMPLDNKSILIERTTISLPQKKLYQYEIYDHAGLLSFMEEASIQYCSLRNPSYDEASGDFLQTTFRLWGRDNKLNHVKYLLQKACDTNVTILLTGESGTGKTYMAKQIHEGSKRQNQPFIHVNCAAIPYTLIESELFGYDDGAFTGAKKGGKKGYFELADHGTIFLDEITEMPLSLQGKLLEVIQNKTFYRVGGTEKKQINVRLIAATNRNLKGLVAAKEFREDLYYRINVFPVELPPLRDRLDALYTIITTILPEIYEKMEIEPLILSPQSLKKMQHYSWPGNIRELENVLEKASILCDGKVIMPEDITLPAEGKEDGIMLSGSLKERKDQCEKQAILYALKIFNGEKNKAAKYLSISRTSLFEKIRKHNIGNLE